MDAEIDKLPKYIALGTTGVAQDYIRRIKDVVDWFPDPERLGYELVGCVETQAYHLSAIADFARNEAVVVNDYGPYICEQFLSAAQAFAKEIYRQVNELNLYVNGELGYQFKCWAGLELVLEKLPDEHIRDFLTLEEMDSDDYEHEPVHHRQSPPTSWQIRGSGRRYIGAVRQPDEHQRLQVVPNGYQGADPADIDLAGCICY